MVGAIAVADPPVTTTLSNGGALSVQIQQPTHDQEFRVPATASAIDVGVSGTASVGQGEPDATIIYVIDVSGSTSSGGGTGCSPILGCEKQFFVALNSAAIADGSTDLAGVVRFSSSASIAQPLTSPTDPAINTAINSSTAFGGTNCESGLTSALALATSAANTNGTTIVVFASDGMCNAGGAVGPAAAALGATGAIVHSVAVGSGSDCTTNGGTGKLNDIPQNGGSCTEVPDPGNLPNIIQNLIGSTLDSLAIKHDGGGASPIPNSQISLPLPQPGAVSVTYGPTTVAALGPATHQLCVDATGSDVLGDTETVTDCHTIQLLKLTASPTAAANNLNLTNSHTVNAAIVGGTGPSRNINFAVGGTNAATATPPSGAVLAAPNAPVSFTYSVPKSCASLGTDTITVTTQIGGESDSITLTKHWFDDVPPTVICEPTVNPHGNKEPQAPGNGGQGQNQDGFYQLVASDPNLADCPVTLKVSDGSGFIFPGPFTPGDNIKYTQADGAPQQQKKIGSGKGSAGAVLYHLIGHGDLVVTGTDPSGNTASVTCLVPPPPK